MRPSRKRHDDGENHRGGADDRGADEHGLGGSLKRVARAVVGLEHFLGALEVDVDVVIFFQLLLNSWNSFDQRESVHGLRVVRDRAVRIDRDRDRPHAQEAESHQTESKHRRRQHHRAKVQRAD